MDNFLFMENKMAPRKRTSQCRSGSWHDKYFKQNYLKYYYQSLQNEDVCTFFYISRCCNFQKLFFGIPLINLLGIFVDFQLFLKIKPFFNRTMSDVRPLFRPL